MCILSIWVGGSNAVATAYCGVSVIAPSWIHPCFLSLWYVHRALLIILCFCDCAGTESHPFSIHLFSCCKCKIFNAGLHAPLLCPLKCIRWIPLVSISQLIMKSCADLPTFWWYVWDYKSRHCLLLIFFSGIYKWKLGEISKSAKGRFIYKEEFQRSGSQHCLNLFQEHISFLFHLWHPAQHAHRPLRPCGKHTDGNM